MEMLQIWNDDNIWHCFQLEIKQKCLSFKNSKKKNHHQPPLNNAAIAKSESFKLELRLIDETNNVGTINVEISNFWRTLETHLINCEINLFPSCSANCIIFEGKRVTTFTNNRYKLYDPVVPFSIKDIAKLLQKLKFGFKRTINWSKYESKVSIERQK